MMTVMVMMIMIMMIMMIMIMYDYDDDNDDGNGISIQHIKILLPQIKRLVLRSKDFLCQGLFSTKSLLAGYLSKG